MIKNQIPVSVSNSFTDEGDGLVSFPNGLTITDDTVMRSGTKYDINSLDTSKYQGQLTADHVDSLSTLIGKTIGLSKVGNRVSVQAIKYAVNENPLARIAYNLLIGGFSNSFSIETIGGYPDQSDPVYRDHELVGLSQVVIPNNYNAKLNEFTQIVRNSLEQSEKDGLDVAGVEDQVLKTEGATDAEVVKDLDEIDEIIAEVEETETKEPVEKTDKTDKENKDSTEVKTDDTADQVDEETNNNMTTQEKAAELVVNAPVVEVVKQEEKIVAVNKNAVRKNFVNQLKAVYAGNNNAVVELAKEGAKLEGKVDNALNLTGVYLSEVLKADVKEAFFDAGGVGSLVQREDITGAVLLNLPVETRGTGFVATALGALKSEDAPVWAEVEVRPYEHSLVTQWSDSAAEQTPIAVYNFVVRYIANQYKVLEDKVILTNAAATVGSENRAATGLVPLLQAAHRSSTLTAMTAQYVVPGIARAFGEVQSTGELTIVANRATWGSLAVAQDANYNTVFNAVGNKVTIGALGTFNVVTSEALDTETIVVGNFADYTVATRGGLSTLFSQEATVGSTNLFMQNGSAIRASVNIGGAPAPITSFWLLTTAGYVS